ncbi:FprA family A-type flavoprotein [Desulfurivibrio dismutans]|uniref:FprA family A-type flavoprotein n=1 Tax=Desulfurivibrio dismutans TaxID=1398908 RepID=UPI0023DCD845|nr:flavodoxin domain-containing protein [Desulfurivibrio alkaliphilus]MDF1613924.1 flavodoxin domain-containing protein [Desulfurivibrio alkaliphilus]
MKAVEIKPDIFWVGAVDWNNRDFHGYSIKKGTTYNAYLVRDEKTVLFDTVRQGFKGDLLHHLRQLIEPEKIDYIVVNHVELDHSGCLPELIELIKPEKIFCSPMGKKVLLEHFHRPDWPLEVVKTGDQIELGRRTVRFIETRMLHWPDSMFSYIPEEKLLISSDAFGQHWATSQRFDDEVDQAELLAHSAKYYANILLLYSPLVEKLLAQVQADGLEIEMIAPDHGLIWRRNPSAILEAYQRWSSQQARSKAVIIYDSMWHSTEKMAKAVLSGLQDEGIKEISLLHARKNHRSDIMTEVLEAGAVILGSATLNNNIMPAMADVLTYMKGLRPKNKIGAAFGSFGWSGEAVKHLNGYLEEMGVELVGEGVRIKNVPTHETLADCVELGHSIARALNGTAGR